MNDALYLPLAIWIILEIILVVWWKHEEVYEDIKSNILAFLAVSCVTTPVVSGIIAGGTYVFIELFMKYTLLFTIAFTILGIMLVILYWDYLKVVFNKIYRNQSLKLFIYKKMIKIFRKNGDKK